VRHGPDATVHTTRTTLQLAEHTHTYGLSLSGLAVSGDGMVLAPDEGAALVRLSRLGDEGGGDPVELALADAVDLPGDAGDEVDVEGIDHQGSLHDCRATCSTEPASAGRPPPASSCEARL
jgi:hypothetical protein